MLYGEIDLDGYPSAESLRGFASSTFANGGTGSATVTTNVTGVQMCIWSAQPDSYSEAHVASRLYPAGSGR